MSNCFADFLQNNGLYDSFQITETNISELIELLAGKIKLSAYCTECQEMRVFTITPSEFLFEIDGKEKEARLLSDELSRLQTLQQMIFPRLGGVAEKNEWYWTNWQTEKATRIMVLSFVCAMDDNHHLDYVVRTNSNLMVKIGQFPSVADLSFPELKQYEKVIDKQSRRELGTAFGLYAHGVGVGSYVYLRRIFERILDTAKQQAVEDKTVSLAGYDDLRVSDRIKLLKDYLPEMINTNPAIYGIVSKGIHELSEEDCVKFFPVMRDCILVILRQWEAKRKERESIRQLEASISAIATEIK